MDGCRSESRLDRDYAFNPGMEIRGNGLWRAGPNVHPNYPKFHDKIQPNNYLFFDRIWRTLNFGLD
jgi:hypothetical protein